MNTNFLHPTKMWLVFVATIMSCSTQIPVAPAANISGNCIGTILDANGTPVKGASVLLVPGNFVPVGQTSTLLIDSTVSNSDGRFGFSVSKAGTYNLLAAGNNRYAMRTLLRLGGESTVELTAQVLAEPGSLVGTVRLQGMADHRSAIVLFPGTNLYTSPSDSTGKVVMSNLAPGQYSLRIITLEPGFSLAETTITISSGVCSNLPLIELSRKKVHEVSGFSVTYDPAMMTAMLGWQPLDTGSISGYRIYCNRHQELTPVAVLPDTCSMVIFDLVTSSVDTLIYQITAIGPDSSEGPASIAGPVMRTSLIQFEKTITYRTLDNNPYVTNNVTYHFDRDGNIYDLTEKAILKIDQTGIILASFRIPDSSTATFSSYDDISGGIQSDAAGSLYLWRDSTPTQDHAVYTDILKLNDNLNPVAIVPFRRNDLDSSYLPCAPSFLVTGAGTVYTIVPESDSQLHITEYGPDMARKGDRRLPGNWSVKDALVNNDTVFCLTTWPTGCIRYFDADLNQIFSLENDAFIDSAIHLTRTPPSSQTSNYTKYLSPLGVFMTYDVFLDRQPPCLVLLFYNTHEAKLLAKFPWHDVSTSGRFYFDYSGNMYTVKRGYDGDGTAVTIAKYSISHLVQ